MPSDDVETSPSASSSESELDQKVLLLEANMMLEGWDNVATSLLRPEHAVVREAVIQKFSADIRGGTYGLNWLKKAHVLHILDPSINDDIQDKALSILKYYLKELEDMQPKKINTIYGERYETPAESLTKRGVFLMQLAELQMTDEARQLCSQAYFDYENRFKLSNDEINRIVKEGIGSFQESQDYVQTKPFDIFGYNWQSTFPNISKKIKYENETLRYYQSEVNTWKITLDDDILIFCNEKNSNIVFACMCDGLKDNISVLEQMAAKAQQEYAQEQGGQEDKMRSYELPVEKKVAHIRLIDISSHYQWSVTHLALSNSTVLSKVMESRYSNLISRPPLFVGKTDPIEALRGELRELTDKLKGQPLHVCLDVFSHGKQNRLHFGEYKIDAKDLVEIVREFPNISFTVNTIACYGGGLIDGLMKSNEFQSNKELQSRLAVFTHTKGELPNIGTSSINQKLPITDAYFLQFIKALREGKSYGEASFEADTETTKYSPMDAESVIEGQKHVLNAQSKIDSAIAQTIDSRLDSYG